MIGQLRLCFFFLLIHPGEPLFYVIDSHTLFLPWETRILIAAHISLNFVEYRDICTCAAERAFLSRGKRDVEKLSKGR